MEILEIIDKYKEIASFLQNEENVVFLNSLSDRLNNKEYYLPLIGQFSAGKSKMLNRLLGRDILPTKSIETTAFLTYIRYGENESAVLEYLDGTKESITIDEVKGLDYKATKESKAIAALQLKLPLEMLKSGLVLVDTPGVNTLITEHVKMTEDLLFNSQYIMYIMGSAPSASDILMLKKICGLQIPVIFVRTHIDEMKASEENVFDALDKEQKIIEEQLGTEILFFSICNNQDSNLFNSVSSDILLSFLNEDVSRNAESLYIDSILKRLELIKSAFNQELLSRKQLTIDSSSKSADEIQNQISEIKKVQNQVQRDLNDKLRSIKNKGSEVYSTIVKNVTLTKSRSVNKYSDVVDSLGKSNLSNNIQEAFQNNLSSALDDLAQIANQSVQKWLDDSIDEIRTEFSNVSLSLKDVDLSFDTDFTADVITMYEDKQNALISDFQEKYSRLQELISANDEQLQTLGVKREELQSAMTEYDSFVNEHQQEVDTLKANYEPQYIKKGGELGDKMRIVGDVLDIATLLIPAAGWAKLGAACAKGAKALKTGGKVAQLASKALRTASKSARLMAKADKTLDTVQVLRRGLEAYQNGKMDRFSKEMVDEVQKKKKNTGFFDKLSISFWLGKVGDMMDPETYVVDQEYENQYNEIVRQKQNEVNAAIQQKVMIKRMKGEIKAEEEVLKYKNEIQKKEQERLNEDLKRLSEEIEAKKQSEIIKSIKNNAQTQYKQKLDSFAVTLLERVKEQLDYVSEVIISSAQDYASSHLESLESQLTEIKSKRESNEDSLKETVGMIDKYITSLDIA